MLLLKCLDELKKNIQLLVQHSTEVEAVVAIGSTPVTTKEAFTFKVHIKGNFKIVFLFAKQLLSMISKYFQIK